jgi:predicted nucleic acid-binding protein
MRVATASSSLKPSFVLDCSVAANWLFDNEADMAGADYALGLLQRMGNVVAVVPALWHVELASMLRKGVMQKRLALPLDQHMLRLAAFDIRTDAEPVDPLAVATLALESGTSAYDATYLHLCQRLRLPLATLDERLKPCATRAHVKLFEF